MSAAKQVGKIRNLATGRAEMRQILKAKAQAETPLERRQRLRQITQREASK